MAQYTVWPPPGLLGSVTIDAGALEVAISYTDDSIAIADQTGNFLSITPAGSAHVTVDSLPMAPGAALASLQSAGNSSLSSIDSKLTAPLAVTGIFFQATQPVSGTVTISGTTPISGNVSVSNFPATQPISGTVAVSNFPATQAVTGAFFQTTQPVSGSVSVSNFPATQAVTGAFFQATQPISGTVSVSNFPATQAVTQSGTWTTNRGWTLSSGTDSVAVVQSTSPWVVSGTVTANAGSGTFAISAAALPLPAGASTSVLQTTGNTSLNSIDTKTPAFGQAVMASSTPVVIASNQSSIPVTGTFFQATQPVSVSNFPATQAVTGTFFQTTQPVSGTVSVANFPVTQAVTGTFFQATQPVSGAVSVSNFPATQAVTGTFFQATQPVSGTVAASSVPTATDKSGSGNITALNVAITATTNGCSTASFTVLGTWVAILLFEGTADGVNWETVNGNILALDLTTQFIQNNQSISIPCGGFSQVRLRASSYTSGTANVTWNAGAGVAVVAVYNNVAASLNAQIVGNVAAGSADSGNGVKVSGVYNSTAPVLSTGQRGDIQVTPSAAIITSQVDGYKTSYSAAVTALTIAAAATDIFTITGSASKTIRITKVEISGTQTVAGDVNVLLIKRSAANTGGTSAAVTAVPHDSTNAGATATVLSYTANPAVGAVVGTIRSTKMFDSTSTTTPGLVVEDFGTRPAQAVVLRGITQVLAINLNGGTAAGSSIDISLEWTEE